LANDSPQIEKRKLQRGWQKPEGVALNVDAARVRAMTVRRMMRSPTRRRPRASLVRAGRVGTS
jgi:hypothetical protein